MAAPPDVPDERSPYELEMDENCALHGDEFILRNPNHASTPSSGQLVEKENAIDGSRIGS